MKSPLVGLSDNDLKYLYNNMAT